MKKLQELYQERSRLNAQKVTVSAGEMQRHQKIETTKRNRLL